MFDSRWAQEDSRKAFIIRLMPHRQIIEIKRTLTESRQKFERLVRQFPATQVDSRTSLLLADWQAFIENDDEIAKLAHVENFQSVCGIGSKLSSRQSYSELLMTAVSGFAEIDLAVHIVREKKGHVKKLMEGVGAKQCDFQVELDPPLLVESKYIETPTVRKLEAVLVRAVDQIVETARSQTLCEYDGSVWAFSYLAPAQINNMQLQALITGLVSRLGPQVPGELRVTFQVYAHSPGAGLYGSSCL